MRRAVSVGACLIVFQAQGIGAAAAVQFPIKTEADAIALAKSVCLKNGPSLSDEDGNLTTVQNVMPTLKWGAALQKDKSWVVDTMASVMAGTNSHLLFVEIPAQGPAPTRCWDSLYTLVGPAPKKPPRGPCTPSDLSALNAVQLAEEAYTRGELIGRIMYPPPRSELDAWVVSVRVAAPPNTDSEELGLFKVFKRTANVQNVKSGEEFNSLPSKAHYVELHCLDGPLPAK